MKKIYTKPISEIDEFKMEEVLTTSGDPDTTTGIEQMDVGDI